MGTLQQMAQSNPNMQNALDYINSHGGDPKTAFYVLARENNADPNQVLNDVKNQIGGF